MFDGKVILVTGGTGSFGKKFTQVMLTNFSPQEADHFQPGRVEAA